jgi:hypothetical protein
MKANGLQAAGYTLINVGGNGHAVNGSNDPAHSSATAIGHDGKPLNCTAAAGCYIAARNSTGHHQPRGGTVVPRCRSPRHCHRLPYLRDSHTNRAYAAIVVTLSVPMTVSPAARHYQIDAARFPGPGSTLDCLNDTALAICMGMGGAYGDGPNRDPRECGCVNGNAGMRALADELRGMGYQWGSYNAMGSCSPER